jgi:hypothetical protein
LKGLIVTLNNQEVFWAQNHPENCTVVKFLLKISKMPKNASGSQVGNGSGGKGLRQEMSTLFMFTYGIPANGIILNNNFTELFYPLQIAKNLLCLKIIASFVEKKHCFPSLAEKNIA